MKKSVAIIGGGPSALALAAFLDPTIFDVSIYEKNKSLGRKFLVAGKGGFNLTHSEPIEQLISRYSNDEPVKAAVKAFTNHNFRNWLASIDIPTFIGSSKRVYPEKGIKPIEVLNRILSLLQSKNVHFHFESNWTGWDSQNALTFTSGNSVKADIVVFALGGGSWKVTGSDGSWLETFRRKGIETRDFLPTNCAYSVDWNADLLAKIEGAPLKNITISTNGKTCNGEAVVTQFGIEGNAIYALSAEIQNQLLTEGKATVYVDFKPMFSDEQVLQKMEQSNLKITDLLRKKLNLSKTHIHLLKHYLDKEAFLSKTTLAAAIKQFPLTLEAAAPIDEAISTTGGISMDAIHANFELKHLPNTYCLGEMLDWNAPTGGYLLQACFSMGVFLAKELNQLDS
ncbi:MAG: TIGR03862 family flavoprotein [Flavobacteriales bacterium]|nr:TIGR03862 family flavoprotein [Flavobacteriales bacterium]